MWIFSCLFCKHLFIEPLLHASHKLGLSIFYLCSSWQLHKVWYYWLFTYDQCEAQGVKWVAQGCTASKEQGQIWTQYYLGVLVYQSGSHLLFWGQRVTHFYTSLGMGFVFEILDQRALPCSFSALPLSPLATAWIQTLFISLVYSCSNLVPGLYDSVLRIPSLSTTLLLVISF